VRYVSCVWAIVGFGAGAGAGSGVGAGAAVGSGTGGGAGEGGALSAVCAPPQAAVIQDVIKNAMSRLRIEAS
jgi:hypothetical protein